ncbi:MAG: non-canonical purine NTP diphosphatase [Bacteroidales bacterium]|nr:non-canonical purine NTP diphosphatase [Bacteroidales bacterium]
MRTLIFASNNSHKLSEIRNLLDNIVNILSLKDINLEGDIPETSDTLEGNATQKAEWIYSRIGQDCFADDTGLEVEALDGAPGVYSARYAGEGCSFADNVNKLLKAMKGQSNRKARFRTVICLIENGKKNYFEGIVNGTIVEKGSGNMGFGYDPIFVPDGYNISFAEMPLDEKNKISHRGLATQKLVEYLKSK